MPPTNPHAQALISRVKQAARQQESRLLFRIAEALSKPSRQRVTVNLGKINRIAKDGETIIIPGKLLGTGMLEKDVTIIAWQYSLSVPPRMKKGRLITLREALDKPDLFRKARIIA